MLRSASRLLPVIALASQPIEKILDMCALIRNSGILVANDANKDRAKAIIAHIYIYIRMNKQYSLNNQSVKLVETDLEFGVKGFTNFKGRTFHLLMKYSRQFDTYLHNLDGFFVAKLKTNIQLNETIKKVSGEKNKNKMDVFGMITRLPSLAFGASRCDDSFADRLSYKYTVFMLALFAIVVTNKQFGTKHIQCWVPAQFTKNYEEYVNDICWVSNTYYIPLEQKVPKLEIERRQNELRYYQWIPFILLLQAFCFYFPHIIWRSLSRRSGIDVRDIVDAAIHYKSVDIATKDDEHKNELMEYIVETIDKYVDDPRRQTNKRSKCMNLKYILMTICICMGKYLGNYLIVVYFTTKALFIINAVCQIFLLNLFLGQKFHLFGIQVLKRILQGQGWDTQSKYFPKVTLCDFQIRETLHQTDSHRYTVQCVLPLNLFSQQIFTFIWFWYMMVFIVSIFDVIVWVIRFLPNKQYNYIKRRLQLMRCDNDFNSQSPEYIKRWYMEFIYGYLEPDGIFMLRLLSSNTSDFVCTEVINQLWQSFYAKDLKRLKHTYKRDLGGEQITSEIKREISDSVDSLQGDDSIRRRNINFSSISTQKSSIDKTDNGYESLTTGKKSSFIPLFEDDV
ncbi:unnamed protein product [Rotaria sp. Silwood1]|nr:unnamed protein product [Rotaria sp. Silwood1]